MSLHISLCTLEKEIKKKKLEVVAVDRTRKQLLKSRTRKHTVEVKNKFDDAGVEEFVTIASKEEDKFEGSVSEYAAQLTKNPGLAAAQVVVQRQVQVRRGDLDVDAGGDRPQEHPHRRDACRITLFCTRLQPW